jgi:GTPase SAR1 family protein
MHYTKGAHGVLLLYSITDRKSFQNVNNWIKQVVELAPADVSVILVANKSDLASHEREVSYEEGRSIC